MPKREVLSYDGDPKEYPRFIQFSFALEMQSLQSRAVLFSQLNKVIARQRTFCLRPLDRNTLSYVHSLTRWSKVF